ncbi:MAG: hypothetical protein ACREKM_07835 [Longimicrobiales bacterium]
MRRRVLAVAAAIALCGAAWQPSDRISVRETHVRAEVERLRAHFETVDAELRARDVSGLSVQQRAARTRLIAWLQDYSAAGEFPLNDGQSDVAVPIFRDADGTLCAMAYLIARDGRTDIVDRVANARNTAYIRELVDDPELVAWLDEVGLTAAEAARIQPQYGPVGPWPQPAPVAEGEVSADYALASMALAGASVVTSWINFDEPTRTTGIVGLAAGSAAVLAGVSRFDDDGGTARLAVANTVVGAVAIGAAVHGLLSLRDSDRTETSLSTRVGSTGLSVGPDVITVADRPALGLMLRARF